MNAFKANFTVVPCRCTHVLPRTDFSQMTVQENYGVF